jgi:hypothetical protein
VAQMMFVLMIAMMVVLLLNLLLVSVALMKV